MEFKDVETKRQTYYEKLRNGYLISFGISVILSIIVLFASGSGSGFGLIIILLFSIIFFGGIGAIVTSFATRQEATDYRRAYKAYFIERNLAQTFTNLSYSHEKGLARQALSDTGMVNTGDVYDSNDFTSGSYKNTAFAQADVHIQTEYTDSDGNTQYVTIFRGRVMIFEFPKKFNFKLELVGRKFRAYRVPGKDKVTQRKMTKISTESNEFDHVFKTYGEDGFEAFYILNPKIMSRMIDISEHYKNKILFGFTDNRLFILLDNGKDSFEPPRPNRPIDEQAELAKVAADIKVITDFVDQLSLERKIFI